VYQVVLEAQQKALEVIRAGVKGSDVDAAARDHIESSGFPGGLIHSTGHGLGLAVHDGGRMAPNDSLVLEENMIMTVEPGIYIPGEGGVRIEDDVRVTKDGYEMLTSADKRLKAV
jgi:Xaa-Pro aminopeptidase